MGQTAVNRVVGPSRIVGPIDEAQLVTLLGNVHPLARGEFDQGVLGADTELGRMVLELEASRAQQEALDALVEAQHDAGSGLYRRWLTPAEYGARFGASAEDLARVTAWLKGHGFTVEEIPASNRLVIFSGTEREVAETFHTEIHRYLVDGVEHIANAQDPQIPAALAGVVGGVVSLHDFRRTSEIKTRTALGARAAEKRGVASEFCKKPPSGAKAPVDSIALMHGLKPIPSIEASVSPACSVGTQPLYSSGSTHYLFPADWATIYDLNSLYGAGTAGAGTSIAIVGRSNINVGDVTAFRATAGLTANTPAVILAGADPGLVSGDQDEATLDVEWSGAVAPAAAVKLVVGASAGTTDGVDMSAQYTVNHGTAPVVSVSYGSCEQDMGTAELAFYNSLWEQAASQGMSSFVASGDAGAAGCSGGSSTSGSGTAVNGLCSSPYSTCVGGTEFNEGSNYAQYWAATNSANDGSALSYIPEEVWNESGLDGGSGLWASGGGASVVYAQPAWQKGVSGTSASNGMRAVPDVALTAAGHDGYVIYENGSYYVISGTSAASPSFAGVMALVVEKQGGTGVGNANAGLYSLLSAAHNPFHATPSGNNSVPGVAGFTASGAEYNLATGLGSVDGALLVSGWGAGAGSTTGTDFALTASATGGTVLVGTTARFTVSVTESGLARNAVTLAATGPNGVVVAVQPGSITPGTAAVVTIAVGSTAAAGAQNVTLTGSDASGTQTLTYALTVTLAPTLTLTAASSSAAAVQGGSGTVSLTAGTGGSFSGNISFSVSGLPAGVTVGWSANPIAPASSVSANPVTLTLTASATATVGSASVVATAAGDGLVASQSVSLQVQQAPGITLAVSPATLAAGTVGTAYPQTTIAAGGGTAPYSYSVSSGALPTGLTLSKAGVLSGTPTAVGSFTFTVTATDSSTGTRPHSGSQCYTVTINLTAATDFTINVASGTSGSATVLPGGTTGETFTVSPANGATTFPNAIALSASGLPTGAAAVFSPVSVPAGSGTTTAKLTIQLPQASATAQPAGCIGSGIGGRLAPLSLALLLLPIAGRLRRGGKRLGRLMSVLLLAVAGMAAMAGLSGCGSISGFLGQTPQTYTVTVTGTSGALSHSTTVTLTVE